ncbi:MAG: TRAP transporter small permease subunit [Spirochaetaceae bacterium]|jgi:TRAP-type C4-dicarboxylate transport system permease small subunit|nr:TRAP transporter small permease subunit [Spirochaetaceae bacterium]
MRKLYHTLCKVEVAVCGAGFVLLVAFIFLSAILRGFRISMSWNIDLALFLLAWTAFLGADIAWRSGQLVGIDIVTRSLPAVVQKILEMLIYVIVLAALVVVIVFGIRLAWTERLRTYQSIPIPFSLVTVSLVVAALSMVLSTILKIKRCVYSFTTHKER